MPTAFTAPSSTLLSFSPRARRLTIPAQQTGSHDPHAFEAELLHVAIELAFDAAVEQARSRIRRGGGDQHVRRHTVLRRRLGELELGVVVHFLLRRLAAGLFQGRAE